MLLRDIVKYTAFILSLSFSIGVFAEENLSAKKQYKLVISEIVQILNRNHFKKNIEISEGEVIGNFFINLDKEKIIFSLDEVDSLSQEFENIFDVEKIFDIYRFYSDRSLELINHQNYFYPAGITGNTRNFVGVNT